MEMFYTNNANSSNSDSSEKMSSGSSSLDSSNKSMIGRTRYPLSVSSYLSPAFSSCVSLNPYCPDSPDVDPSLLRFSRAATGTLRSDTDQFFTPAADSKQLHRLLQQHHKLPPVSSLGSSSSTPVLSPIENLETPPSRLPYVYRTPLNRKPVKLTEEEVLVMDEVPVNALGGNRARMVPDCGPSSSATNNLYKTEICRAWEDTGSCRYGSKCQFAHGKEELRPSSRQPKQKREICVAFATTGSCAYGGQCRYLHQQATTKQAPAPARIPGTNPSQMKYEELVALGMADEATEAYVKQILHGPSTRRRLPAFKEICPD